MAREAVTSLSFGSVADLETTRAYVETALSIQLEERESSYRAGLYYMTRLDSREQILVQVNSDGEEPAEDVAIPTIVYVEVTQRPDEILALFADGTLQLIRREEWTTDSDAR